MCQRSEHLLEQVRFAGNPLQVRLPVAIVIRNGVGLEKLAVFYQQFDWRGTALRGLDRAA